MCEYRWKTSPFALHAVPVHGFMCPTREVIFRTENTIMNTNTMMTLALAKTLAKSGFQIPAIEIHTPDGRTWNIVTVPAGRGRHADGHWGPRPSALGGFRLFEIDRDTNAPDEHDAADGDTWTASELIDYLRAVGNNARPAT